MSQTAIEDAPVDKHASFRQRVKEAIPPNLETMLFARIGGEPLISHSNEDEREHKNIGVYTAAAVIQLVREQAGVARSELKQTSGVEMRIIPGETVWKGLRRFYDQIHRTPAQAGSLYESYVDVLRERGSPFMDVHVAHALAEELRGPRDEPMVMFEDWERTFLADEVLPETFAAQSLAIQTLRRG